MTDRIDPNAELSHRLALGGASPCADALSRSRPVEPTARRVTFGAERVFYAGGRSLSTGRVRVTDAPRGFVLATESGRMIEVGDTIGRGEVLCAIPSARFAPFVGERLEVLPYVFPVLSAIASALFGWLP